MIRQVALAVVVSLTAPLPAVAVEATGCMDSPPRFVIEGADGEEPVITTSPRVSVKILHVDAGDCPEPRVAISNFASPRDLSLDQIERGPRYFGEFGRVDLAAGETSIDYFYSGDRVVPVGLKFDIRLGSKVIVDPVDTVNSPARSIVSGVVKTYRYDGALVGSGWRKVEIRTHPLGNPRAPFVLVATTVTDVLGLFRVALPFTENQIIEVTALGVDRALAPAESERVEAHVRMVWALAPLPARWPAGTWFKITGRTFPGRRMVFLAAESLDGTSSIGGSFKPSNPDGTFTLYFQPLGAGGLYVTATMVRDDRNDGGGYTKTWRMDVVRRTTLIGITKLGVVRPGTKMSTYGRLSVLDRTTKPFPGQRVLIQTRPLKQPSAPYRTVATATTTSTGYYYANWIARTDVAVRVGYPSGDRYTNSVYTFVRSVDVR